ncbi:GNAT family N-acetyltransferase [Pseudomonas koreensis]|uniref:GNAT family N-acetyltransferase n=1 Tax=Pseudomonas koreensis TaxID=198620 RepID=UPI003F86F0E4
MKIRQLKVSEWRIYRDLRLCALAESPDAFGSTLAAEQIRADAAWRERVGAGVVSDLDLPLVAEIDQRPVGLVWAKISPADTSLAHIYQMWVAPDFRGRGVGRALLGRVIEWARERGAQAVHLGVTVSDTPAMKLYLAQGFICSGPVEALREGSLLQVQPMALRL